jgi:tRNA dimethylallyltransferase
MGYSATLNSLNTVGYKEVISYLNGEISQDKAIEEIKKNTRRYAKRQIT